MGNVLFPSLSRLLDVPLGTVTLLVSVWAFTGLLAPLFGLLSDRYGHSTFLLLGMGVFVLGNGLCAVAPSFPALLVCQVLVGLGYAVFGFSASAVVGDAFAYATRARAMGIVRLAVSAAALAGVPAAAAIAEWGPPRAAFGTVAGLGLVLFIVALALLPRLTRRTAEAQPAEAKANPWRAATAIVRQRSVLAGLLAVLGWAAIPTGTFIYLAAWLEQRFRFTETWVGLAFSLVGVGALIGNVLTAALADRLGKKRSAVLGLLVLSATTLLLPRLPGATATMAVLVVFTAALEFSFSSFSTLLTELAPESRGTLMSLVSLANGVGTGLVPLLMRPLWEGAGYRLITTLLGGVGLGMAVIVGVFVAERQCAEPVLDKQNQVG
jgi:predicted MFS family arabinose efflux permease